MTTEHFVNYFTERLTLKLWKSRYDESDRQDLIQETFMRVLAKLRAEKGIRSAEKFGAYVFGVCDNCVRERIRLTREAQLDEDSVNIPALGPTAEQLWIQGEEAADVVQTLRLMRPADAKLLIDLLVRRRPKDDICRETGSTRGNLRVKLHRAIARFRFVHLKRKGTPPRGGE